MINKLFGALLFVIVAIPLALAGSSTILYQSAGTIPFAITTDGSGNAISRQTIWDYSAAANGVAVDSSHNMQVVETNSAALLSAVQGPVPAGTNTIGAVAPQASTSTQTKVTITTGSTYQQYLASNSSRKGCTIQFITASHTGYVFFGAAPGDTTTSWQLSPGQSLNCNVSGTVLTDAIQLTSSNNSDVFVVNSW